MNEEISAEKLIFEQIDRITGFNNANELEFIIDEVTDATINNTEEKTDVTGRGGRKISSIKKNKAVKVSGTNGIVTAGLMCAQLGTDRVVGKQTIRKPVLFTYGTTTTITETPVGTAGSEITEVYVHTKGDTLGKKFVQVTGTPKTGEFKFDSSTKTFTFFSGDIETGTELVAFIDVSVENGVKISNNSDNYSKTLKLYVDATAKDTCDAEHHVQFIIPRADFNGNFDFSMGKDVSTQAFEAEALAGGCTGSTNFYDMIIY